MIPKCLIQREMAKKNWAADGKLFKNLKLEGFITMLIQMGMFSLCDFF